MNASTMRRGVSFGGNQQKLFTPVPKDENRANWEKAGCTPRPMNMENSDMSDSFLDKVSKFNYGLDSVQKKSIGMTSMSTPNVGCVNENLLLEGSTIKPAYDSNIYSDNQFMFSNGVSNASNARGFPSNGISATPLNVSSKARDTDKSRNNIFSLPSIPEEDPKWDLSPVVSNIQEDIHDIIPQYNQNYPVSEQRPNKDALNPSTANSSSFPWQQSNHREEVKEDASKYRPSTSMIDFNTSEQYFFIQDQSTNVFQTATHERYDSNRDANVSRNNGGGFMPSSKSAGFDMTRDVDVSRNNGGGFMPSSKSAGFDMTRDADVSRNNGGGFMPSSKSAGFDMTRDVDVSRNNGGGFMPSSKSAGFDMTRDADVSRNNGGGFMPSSKQTNVIDSRTRGDFGKVGNDRSISLINDFDSAVDGDFSPQKAMLGGPVKRRSDYSSAEPCQNNVDANYTSNSNRRRSSSAGNLASEFDYSNPTFRDGFKQTASSTGVASMVRETCNPSAMRYADDRSVMSHADGVLAKTYAVRFNEKEAHVPFDADVSQLTSSPCPKPPMCVWEDCNNTNLEYRFQNNVDQRGFPTNELNHCPIGATNPYSNIKYPASMMMENKWNLGTSSYPTCDGTPFPMRPNLSSQDGNQSFVQRPLFLSTANESHAPMHLVFPPHSPTSDPKNPVESIQFNQQAKMGFGVPSFPIQNFQCTSQPYLIDAFNSGSHNVTKPTMTLSSDATHMVSQSFGVNAMNQHGKDHGEERRVQRCKKYVPPVGIISTGTSFRPTMHPSSSVSTFVELEQKNGMSFYPNTTRTSVVPHEIAQTTQVNFNSEAARHLTPKKGDCESWNGSSGYLYVVKNQLVGCSSTAAHPISRVVAGSDDKTASKTISHSFKTTSESSAESFLDQKVSRSHGKSTVDTSAQCNGSFLDSIRLTSKFDGKQKEGDKFVDKGTEITSLMEESFVIENKNILDGISSSDSWIEQPPPSNRGGDRKSDQDGVDATISKNPLTKRIAKLEKEVSKIRRSNENHAEMKDAVKEVDSSDDAVYNSHNKNNEDVNRSLIETFETTAIFEGEKSLNELVRSINRDNKRYFQHQNAGSSMAYRTESSSSYSTKLDDVTGRNRSKVVQETPRRNSLLSVEYRSLLVRTEEKKTLSFGDSRNQMTTKESYPVDEMVDYEQEEEEEEKRFDVDDEEVDMYSHTQHAQHLFSSEVPSVYNNNNNNRIANSLSALQLRERDSQSLPWSGVGNEIKKEDKDLDVSYAWTTASTISMNSLANQDDHPQLCVTSKCRSRCQASSKQKEITLQACPGQFVTIPLAFTNRKKDVISLYPKVVFIRGEHWNGKDARPIVKENDEEANAKGIFTLSPHKLKVFPGENKSFYLTFAPPYEQGEGIYSGSLNIMLKSKTTTTILLRGEAMNPNVPCEEESLNNVVNALPQSNDSNVDLNASFIVDGNHHHHHHHHHENAIELAEELEQPCTPRQQKDSRSSSSNIQQKLLALQQSIDRCKVMYSNRQELSSRIHQPSSSTTFSNSWTVSESSVVLRPQFDLDRSSTLSPSSVIEGEIVIINAGKEAGTLQVSLSTTSLHLSKSRVSLSGLESAKLRVFGTLGDLTDKHQQNQNHDVDMSVFLGLVSVSDGSGKEIKLDMVMSASIFSRMTKNPSPSAGLNRNSTSNPMPSQTVSEIAMDRTSPQELPQESSSSRQAAVPSVIQPDGIFFRRSEVDVGMVPCGSVSNVKIELCNSSSDDISIRLADPGLPFVLMHSDIFLRGRSYVRIPLRFIPVTCGSFSHELVAQSIDQNYVSRIILKGSSY